jgi:hypothetical protein
LDGHELHGAPISTSPVHDAGFAESSLEVASPDPLVAGALVTFDAVFACDDAESTRRRRSD